MALDIERKILAWPGLRPERFRDAGSACACPVSFPGSGRKRLRLGGTLGVGVPFVIGKSPAGKGIRGRIEPGGSLDSDSESPMRGAALVLLAALVRPAPPPAAPDTDRTLEPAPAGQLQVFVAVSDSPDYIEQWPRNSAGRKVVIPQIKEIDLGRTAYISFIVTGYTLDDHRSPDVTVDVSILQRDGEVFFEKEAYAAIQGGPAAPKGLLMADPTLEMDLDLEDLPGTYGILVVVHDRISGRKAQGGYALLANKPEPHEEKGKEKEKEKPKE
jgi:hypothetical protein